MTKKILSLIILVAVIIGIVTVVNHFRGDTNRDVLVMATNAEFPPFEFYDGDKIVGIDVEFAQAIAEKLGKQLEVTDMAFDSIIPAVQSGKADFGAAGMTVTEDRLTQVDFSDPYFNSVQVIIVGEDNSDINGPDDLQGKTIGVVLGFTGDLFATEDFGEDHIQRFNKGFEAVQALAQGKIDAVIIDEQPAKQFVSSTAGLRIVSAKYAEEAYAMCFPKGSDLVAKFNQAIQELKTDGTFDRIVNKYIGD